MRFRFTGNQSKQDRLAGLKLQTHRERGDLPLGNEVSLVLDIGERAGLHPGPRGDFGHRAILLALRLGDGDQIRMNVGACQASSLVEPLEGVDARIFRQFAHTILRNHAFLQINVVSAPSSILRLQ